MWFSRESDSSSSLAPGLCTACWFGWECAVRLRGVEPGRWQHRPAGCSGGRYMPSSQLTGCVGAAGRSVSGVGRQRCRAPSTRSLSCCLGVKRRYSSLDRHRQSYSFWVADKLLLVCRSWLSVVWPDWLALLGVSSCRVFLDVAAGYLFLVLELTSSWWIFFLTKALIEWISAGTVTSFYPEFSLLHLPCHWLVGRFGRRG